MPSSATAEAKPMLTDIACVRVRTTVLIGPDGKIKKIWDAVKAKGHAEEVLEELEKLA